MEARNTKCRPYIHENDLTYFNTLTGRFTISMYSGKTPSYMECLLNPVNKGKYKRNVFVSYLLLSLFRIILLGLSWARHYTDQIWSQITPTKIWSQISYGNTALPLAPDLQTFKPNKDTNYHVQLVRTDKKLNKG